MPPTHGSLGGQNPAQLSPIHLNFAMWQLCCIFQFLYDHHSKHPCLNYMLHRVSRIIYSNNPVRAFILAITVALPSLPTPHPCNGQHGTRWYLRHMCKSAFTIIINTFLRHSHFVLFWLKIGTPSSLLMTYLFLEYSL